MGSPRLKALVLSEAERVALERAGGAAADRAGAGAAGADRVGVRRDGQPAAGRRAARRASRHGAQMAPSFRRAPIGRAARRAALGRAAQDRRRADRGGDQPNPREPAGRRHALELARHGQGERPVRRHGAADLAGLRPAATPGRDLQAVDPVRLQAEGAPSAWAVRQAARPGHAARTPSSAGRLSRVRLITASIRSSLAGAPDTADPSATSAVAPLRRLGWDIELCPDQPRAPVSAQASTIRAGKGTAVRRRTASASNAARSASPNPAPPAAGCPCHSPQSSREKCTANF